MIEKIHKIYLLRIIIAGLTLGILALYIGADRQISKILNFQDNFSQTITGRDSVNYSKAKVNAAIIEKYVDGCNLKIDGQKISTAQLISLVSSLHDSIALLNYQKLKLQKHYVSFIDQQTQQILKQNALLKKQFIDSIQWK